MVVFLMSTDTTIFNSGYSHSVTLGWKSGCDYRLKAEDLLWETQLERWIQADCLWSPQVSKASSLSSACQDPPSSPDKLSLERKVNLQSELRILAQDKISTLENMAMTILYSRTTNLCLTAWQTQTIIDYVENLHTKPQFKDSIS